MHLLSQAELKQQEVVIASPFWEIPDINLLPQVYIILFPTILYFPTIELPGYRGCLWDGHAAGRKAAKAASVWIQNKVCQTR